MQNRQTWCQRNIRLRKSHSQVVRGFDVSFLHLSWMTSPERSSWKRYLYTTPRSYFQTRFRLKKTISLTVSTMSPCVRIIQWSKKNMSKRFGEVISFFCRIHFAIATRRHGQPYYDCRQPENTWIVRCGRGQMCFRHVQGEWWLPNFNCRSCYKMRLQTKKVKVHVVALYSRRYRYG